MANNANDVMRIAENEVGYSRWNDPQTGTKYGRWYAEMTGEPYYGENGVPFCAMFTSWTFNKAGASAAGIPGAYCPWIVNAGRKAGKTVPVSQAKYGDIALFDWGKDGVSDHVGLVKSNGNGVLYTVEGNTNNGQVAYRTRAYSTVICVIRPDYDSSASQKPIESKPVGSNPIVSKPSSSTANGAIAEVQKWCNNNYGYSQAVDNEYGPKTKKGLIVALQTELNRQCGARLTVDGVWGPKTRAACINVRRGAKGNITRVLQGALICRGYSTNGFDGDFGGGTEKAVRSFQSKSGILSNGVANKNTWTKLLG